MKRFDLGLSHVAAPALLMLVIYYVVTFVLEANVASITIITLFIAVAAVFGLDLTWRIGESTLTACVLGLIVGGVVVVSMSLIVFMILRQPFLAGQRELLDIVEVWLGIASAYAFGSLVGIAIERITQGKSTGVLLANSITTVRQITEPAAISNLTHRLTALESLVKTLAAFVVAIGALFITVRKLFF